MRIAARLVLIGLLTPVAALADVQPPERDFTPSGAGDPQALTCRAPQQLDNGGLGPQVCMHNRFWAMLTNTGKDLAADGRTVVLRPMVDEPSGAGDPDAVTCRRPPHRSSSRIRHGEEICLTNATWADLRKKQLIITGEGKVISIRNPGPSHAPDNFPMVWGSYGPE